MADKHEPKTKKLMAAHEKRDFNQLDDFLFTVAESIEEAFLRAGAQPGKDYLCFAKTSSAFSFNNLGKPDITC